MPDNNIKVGFQIEDTGNSVSGLTARVKNLRDMLTSVVDTSKNISTSLQARLYPQRTIAGGGAGGGGGGGGRMISTAGEEPDREYDRARGAIGTGAAGRDFAKQSSGLGGFVRLYATLAANVYAAGAAFTALSDTFLPNSFSKILLNVMFCNKVAVPVDGYSFASLYKSETRIVSPFIVTMSELAPSLPHAASVTAANPVTATKPIFFKFKILIPSISL